MRLLECRDLLDARALLEPANALGIDVLQVEVRIEIDDGARSRALAPPMRQDGGMLFEKQCLHGSLPQDAGDNAATITR